MSGLNGRSVTALFQRRVAFLRKFWRADTEETKVLVAAVGDLLRGVFRDTHRIAGADGNRRFIADPHKAVAALDHVPFGHGQLVQLGRYTGLHACPRQRDLWLAGAIE